jgi:hypothetical protein
VAGVAGEEPANKEHFRPVDCNVALIRQINNKIMTITINAVKLIEFLSLHFKASLIFVSVAKRYISRELFVIVLRSILGLTLS